MTTQPDCACGSIHSPQMEYTPGTHHAKGCPLRQESAADRSLVVAGALARHQVRRYFEVMEIAGVEWWEEKDATMDASTFYATATDEQWGQIQDWVKKVTG